MAWQPWPALPWRTCVKRCDRPPEPMGLAAAAVAAETAVVEVEGVAEAVGAAAAAEAAAAEVER